MSQRLGKSICTFEINLSSGAATADERRKGNEMKRCTRYARRLRGTQRFAGIGFSMAAKRFASDSIAGGQTVDLKAVGFTPQPKVVTVASSYGGRDTIRTSGRTIPPLLHRRPERLLLLCSCSSVSLDAYIWLTTLRRHSALRGCAAEPGHQSLRD